jgi:2-isopropylmalate synthase
LASNGVTVRAERLHLYDNTLRGGAQATGALLTPADRLALVDALDSLGLDYVETSWPGAIDDSLLTRRTRFAHTRLSALCRVPSLDIGATRDARLSALRESGAQVVCLAGLVSPRHLAIEQEGAREKAIGAVAEAVSVVASWADVVIFDCEHYFDGFRDDPAFALECAAVAYVHGARWIVLDDTNGGTLPEDIGAVVRETVKAIPGSHLGVRCADDTGSAVAATEAAVAAGARLVAGSINGLGPRCGHANLTTLMGNLGLKRGFALGTGSLDRLTHVSRLVNDRLNSVSNPAAPYVGENAFARYQSGDTDEPPPYEAGRFDHIAPGLVGNRRRRPTAGAIDRPRLAAWLGSLDIDPQGDEDGLDYLVRRLTDDAGRGLRYDGADASFTIRALEAFNRLPSLFRLMRYRVTDERRLDPRGESLALCEATVRVEVDGAERMTAAEGAGPVNALDRALRAALTSVYPALKNIHLLDYKARLLGEETSGARVRVLIDWGDGAGARWTTVGASHNLVEASLDAMTDGLVYGLTRDLPARAASGAAPAKRVADGGD